MSRRFLTSPFICSTNGPFPVNHVRSEVARFSNESSFAGAPDVQMEEKSNVNLLAAGMHREAQQLIAEVSIRLLCSSPSFTWFSRRKRSVFRA